MSAQFLQKIIAQKNAEEQQYGQFDMSKMELKRTPKPLEIGKQYPFGIIAEIKQASPSHGLIRANYDPVAIARKYEQAGVAAISILTEPIFFKGDLEHLKQVRETVCLPILRKDFLISPRQIYESYRYGADIVLLIVACLSDSTLLNLYELTLQLGMRPLVEVHDEHELERALKLNPDLIGINNRNLDTLKVDLNTSLKLNKKIPTTCSVIAESGISEPSYVETLKNSGFAGALIGESILVKDDVSVAIKALQT